MADNNVNQMGWAFQFAPTGPFSLEANKIFKDYHAALDYAKTDPTAYVGNIVVATDATKDGENNVIKPGAYVVGAVGENAALQRIGEGEVRLVTSFDEISGGLRNNTLAVLSQTSVDADGNTHQPGLYLAVSDAESRMVMDELSLRQHLKVKKLDKAEDGYAASYVLTLFGEQLGENTINIPEGVSEESIEEIAVEKALGAIGTIEVSGDSTKGLLTITQKSNTDGKIGLSVDDTVMNTRLEELSAENVNRIYDMARNTVFLNEVPDVVPAQSALTLDLPFITSKSAAVLKGYSVRFSAGNYTKEVLYGERMLEIDIPDTGVQDMQYVISLVHDNTAEVIKRGVIRVALPVGIASSSDGAETTAERSVSWNTALTRNEIHMSDVTLQGPYLHLFVPEQDLYRGRLRNVTSDGFTIPMTAADETVEIDGVSHRFLTSPELNGDTVSNITLHYVSD